jgi:hypothetical protein
MNLNEILGSLEASQWCPGASQAVLTTVMYFIRYCAQRGMFWARAVAFRSLFSKLIRPLAKGLDEILGRLEASLSCPGASQAVLTAVMYFIRFRV